MKIDLSDKIAVVSGSTRGIGFATARGLGESGAAVVVNGRTQVAVDQAVANLNHLVTPARVRGIAADIGTAQGCDFLVAAVPECDILINNLGVYLGYSRRAFDHECWSAGTRKGASELGECGLLRSA